jgi:hypothetical protein
LAADLALFVHAIVRKPAAAKMTGERLWLLLLGLATVVDGLLAGASLDQSIKQLPARHRIGMRAFSAYSRASDLASGLFWYAPLGIAGVVLTLAAAASGMAFPPLPLPQRAELRLTGRRSPSWGNGHGPNRPGSH